MLYPQKLEVIDENLCGYCMASNANKNRLGMEGQVQNSGRGRAHRNTHLNIQGDGHMIFITPTWLFSIH